MAFFTFQSGVKITESYCKVLRWAEVEILWQYREFGGIYD
jgi:hypothetical protein